MNSDLLRWLRFTPTTPSDGGAESDNTLSGTSGTAPARSVAVHPAPWPAPDTVAIRTASAPLPLPDDAPTAGPEPPAPVCLTCRRRPRTPTTGARCAECVRRAHALCAAWRPGDDPIILAGDHEEGAQP